MPGENPMMCVPCGVAMNHHAEKVDYGVEVDGTDAFDPAFGGVVEEIHQCPECGDVGVRPAVK